MFCVQSAGGGNPVSEDYDHMTGRVSGNSSERIRSAKISRMVVTMGGNGAVFC